jgi:hypothetical protein
VAKSLLSLRSLAIALPAVFVLHVLEEAPGFVTWFNSLVVPPINQPLFLSVNAIAFLVTVVVAGLLALAPSPASAYVAVAWIGLLMLANGLFHLVATIAHHRYCPGVITGTMLYLPMSFALMRAAVREQGLSWASVTATAVLGGLPMYVHGYLIVFRGSRLF